MRQSAQVLPSRLLILMLALAAIFLLFSSRVEADQPLTFDRYVVTSGDTLWSIAESTVDDGEDIRQVVSELKALNGLQGSRIVPGQALIIPSD